MQIEYTSQCGQDKCVIEEIFKGLTHGFFVDLGACDGIRISNTYVLEKYFEWDGICVEPNRFSFELLKKNRTCRLDDSFVLDGVQEVTFHQYYGDPVNWAPFSSMYPFEKYEKQEAVKKEAVTCKTISLGQLLLKHGAPNLIHYLSVDTERADYPILEHFFTKEVGDTTIASLTVEHNFEPVREQLRQLLTAHGFVFFKQLMHDDAYINKDFLNLTKL